MQRHKKPLVDGSLFSNAEPHLSLPTATGDRGLAKLRKSRSLSRLVLMCKTCNMLLYRYIYIILITCNTSTHDYTSVISFILCLSVLHVYVMHPRGNASIEELQNAGFSKKRHVMWNDR